MYIVVVFLWLSCCCFFINYIGFLIGVVKIFNYYFYYVVFFLKFCNFCIRREVIDSKSVKFVWEGFR